MTAARRPRSAALLVGSTSGGSANVQSASESFKGSWRAPGAAAVSRPAPFEQRPHLLLDLLHSRPQGRAVIVLLELLPGLEDIPGRLEASGLLAKFVQHPSAGVESVERVGERSGLYKLLNAPGIALVA
jgi:hypothetical protein